MCGSSCVKLLQTEDVAAFFQEVVQLALFEAAHLHVVSGFIRTSIRINLDEFVLKQAAQDDDWNLWILLLRKLNEFISQPRIRFSISFLIGVRANIAAKHQRFSCNQRQLGNDWQLVNLKLKRPDGLSVVELLINLCPNFIFCMRG